MTTPQQGKTELQQAVAIILVEVEPGAGQIVLPGCSPVNLSHYHQQENVTIPGHAVLHEGQTLQIGREHTNELVLDIANVSRFHAILSATSKAVRLSDLSSTNGTMVNGKPVSGPLKLDTGDVIEIGPARLKVELLSNLTEQLSKTSLTLFGTVYDPVMTTGMVTVLVADICDYTRLSELLPTEDITKMLQLWFERVSKIIKRLGGHVDKYIGDCVMAFWRGSDQDTRLLAIEATKAGIAIKRETAILSDSPEWIYADQSTWDCRVSLNTGQVMIGNVGDRGSRDFTVLGDAVNVAFRLGSVAGERGYDFVLGDGTASHVGEAFKLSKLGPVQVKGRSQSVVAYTLSLR